MASSHVPANPAGSGHRRTRRGAWAFLARPLGAPGALPASWLAAGNPGSWQGPRLGMADRVDNDGVFCFANWLFRKPLGRWLSKLFPVLEVSALRSVPL